MAHGDLLSTAASATGRMNTDASTSVLFKSLDESLELVIRQRPSESSSHGFSVWDSSVVMCRYLETTKRRGALAGRAVLELGSGCGLGGIFAARYLGAAVIMSDLPYILDILRLNAASSRSTGSDEEGGAPVGTVASISALDFDDPNGPSMAVQEALAVKPRASDLKAQASADAATAEAGPCHKIDLIIGSDILFSESLVVPLLETIRVAMQEHGARRAVIVHETRCTDLTSLFEREARSRFALSRVRRKKLPPEWCPANIDVYILSPPIRGWAVARPAEGREGGGKGESESQGKDGADEALGAATGGASCGSAGKGAAAPAVSRAAAAIDERAEPGAGDPPAGAGAVAPSDSRGAPAAAGKARRSNRAMVREMLRRKRATEKDHDATLK